MTASEINNSDSELQANELRRRYCLQAMGVDLYMPAFALPNARQAVTDLADTRLLEQAEFDEPILQSTAQDIVTSDVEKSDAPTRTSPALDLNRSRDLNTTTQTKRRQSKDVSEQRVTAQKSAAIGLKFHLRVWRVANDLLVIDSPEREIALPTDTLLRNMMAALGYGANEISKVEHLRWPFADTGVAAMTSDEETDARAMVNAFIDAQQQHHGCCTLLLLGDTAQRYGLISKQDSAQWQCVQLSNAESETEKKAILLPSLTAMLKQPQLKRPTWQAIRHLQRTTIN